MNVCSLTIRTVWMVKKYISHSIASKPPAIRDNKQAADPSDTVETKLSIVIDCNAK